MLSLPHLVVIFVIALVVFGPQKLPELARTLGKLMAEFRKASGDFRSAFEEEIRDLERQARETERKLKEAARMQTTPTPAAEPPPALPPAPAESASIPRYPGEESGACEGADGQWLTPPIPVSDAVIVDLPKAPDLDATGSQADVTRDDDHSQPKSSPEPNGPPQANNPSQLNNGNTNTPAKSSHVDRQPA